MEKLWKNRRWSLASVVALATFGAVGCAADADADAVDGEDESSKDAITQVDHTGVKRQSIGNCWIYATASWLEALNKGAGSSAANTSESWLTYWHWFDQIANGDVGSSGIETGGWYRTAAELIRRYGLMNEGDFLPNEADAEMSNMQKTALDAVNASLKSGVLSSPTARRDRALVRAELDKAWGLSAAQTARMNAVFGKKVNRTLDRSAAANTAALQNKVIPPQDFKARLKDPVTGQFVVGTLSDALGKSAGAWAPPTGAFAWNDVRYPSGVAPRRAFWKRVQRALHDGQPVITSWKVDFNALTRDAKFSMTALDQKGPGRQGGHMTVMHDYQANVPGLGLLKAGVQATPAEMDKALADGTVIEFVRVKNSWGGIRPDRWDQAAIPGYHDLEMAYLNGPIKECGEDAQGNTDTGNCSGSVTPLRDVVLPAGY
jgi:hypothetical protein